jgi:hypothetical protein
LIDGSIGEGSSFHELFGYYAQGVGVTGLCLEVHDLAISKHVAGREKDMEFTRELAKHGMTLDKTLMARLKETEVPKEVRAIIEARIRKDAAQGGKK